MIGVRGEAQWQILFMQGKEILGGGGGLQQCGGSKAVEHLENLMF